MLSKDARRNLDFFSVFLVKIKWWNVDLLSGLSVVKIMWNSFIL